MKPPELVEFKIELEHFREFLLDLLEAEQDIARAGFQALRRLPQDDSVAKNLENLETRLYECKRIARSLSEEVYSLFGKVLDDDILIPGIAQLAVEISISQRNTTTRPWALGLVRQISLQATKFLGAEVSFGRSSVFSDSGQIPVKRMLADLNRLIPAVGHLYFLYEAQNAADAELLRPSNINVEYLQDLLVAARESISRDTSLDDVSREKVVQYLTFVSIEVASDAPAWRKIVGALVIVSTILGGVAAAPDAKKNVHDAIRHLLGTSIESREPPSVGFLPNTTET